MLYVEQAVFTSAETDRSAGYQVVAKSPGVAEADARELAVWGPSHDSMLESETEAVSLNFHPLPSGAFCVSRTTPAGWEYSGRGGHRVYTHCLIVAPEILARFSNNPFSLMKAALVGGVFDVHDQVPARLEPVRLTGGAAPVDQNLLARLAANPGPRKIATLVQSALDSDCVAVSGTPSAAELIAGLFSCLPPQCRAELSFSTGLKFSSRRPFRIVALTDDPAEQRWVAHRGNVTVLQLLPQSPVAPVQIDAWARLIDRVLSSGRTSFLSTQLSKRRFELTPDDLPALGLQLLEEFDASALRTDHANESSRRPGPVPVDPEGLQCAHAAHRRFEKSTEAATAERIAGLAPSKTLDPLTPEALEKLEALDDLVYEAIGGQVSALERLGEFWPQVLAELGDDLVAQSREQYLRYALSIWEDWNEPGSTRNPGRAVQALDVLCVLFDECP